MGSTRTQITIGELLRRYRLDASLTQKDLAQIVPYDHTTISRTERDERLPTAEYLEHFAEALHLTDVQYQEMMTLFRHASGADGADTPPQFPHRSVT